MLKSAETCVLCLLALAMVTGTAGAGGNGESEAQLSAEQMIQRMAEDDYAGRHYHQQLMRLGEPVLPVLIDALDHEAPRVRYWSVAALAKMGHPDAQPAVLQRLEDPDALVRSVAAWHLHRWFDREQVRQAVFDRLTDESQQVQQWAARAIQENWQMEAVRQATLDRMDHESDTVRGWALDIVREQGYGEALPRLREFLRSEDLVRRYAAVRALPQLAGEEAIPLLTEALREDSNPEVRAAAVHGLGEWFDRPPIRRIILDTLQDGDAYVRGWALNVVAEKRYTGALPRVRNLLNAHNPDVRYDAVRTLVNIQGPDALDTLVAVLQEDASPTVRECALRSVTLMRPRTPRTGKLLLRGLSDPHQEVRAAAVELLRKGFNQFFGYRADETPGTRREAIDAWEQWYDRHKDHLRWSEQTQRFELPDGQQ